MIIGKNYCNKFSLSINDAGDVTLKKAVINTNLDNFDNSSFVVLFDEFNSQSKHLSTIIDSLRTSYTFKEYNISNLIYALDYPYNLINSEIRNNPVYFLYKRNKSHLHYYLIYLPCYLKLSLVCYGQGVVR